MIHLYPPAIHFYHLKKCISILHHPVCVLIIYEFCELEELFFLQSIVTLMNFNFGSL